MLKTSAARVFRKGRNVMFSHSQRVVWFACWNANHRTTTLYREDPLSDEGESSHLKLPRLAGRYAAFVAESLVSTDGSERYGDVYVYDLVSGRRVSRDRAGTGTFYTDVQSLALDSSHRVAWGDYVEDVAPSSGRVLIQARDATGLRQLDLIPGGTRSSAPDAASVRIQSGQALWTSSGSPGSAELH